MPDDGPIFSQLSGERLLPDWSRPSPTPRHQPENESTMWPAQWPPDPDSTTPDPDPLASPERDSADRPDPSAVTSALRGLREAVDQLDTQLRAWGH